jgi:hypothetical protein
MQLSFGKSIKSFLVFTAVISALIFCVGGEVNTAVASKIEHRTDVMAPVKVENVSVDFSQAHTELMKKPDEAPVNSF